MLDRPPEHMRDQPIGRRKTRSITKVAVTLAVAKCLALSWLISGPAQVPFSRAEILFMFWTGAVILVAGYLVVQDLMDCPRVRQARTIFRLGMQAERLRGNK